MGAQETKVIYHDFIGGGASGEVFKATWETKAHGKVEAAAKKILFQGEIPEQIKREIEYLKKLDHKNIIKYYDTIIEAKHVVIVTEYAAKGSLYDYLKDKTKLPTKLLHVWIFHLASGIDYLTQNKIAHRDLKSPNCVITTDDVLKICDFGIARDLSSTTTTKMKGSYKWLAPEAIRDEKLSPKVDIFALAIIVWEMLRCEEPYKGIRKEAIMYKVCNDGLRPQIPDDCPPFLRELMETCWHADRQMRPNSAEVVRMVCREYIDDLRKDTESLAGYLTKSDGLEWKLKQKIESRGEIQFVSNDRLAICREDDKSVEVHQVTRESTQILYKLRCNEWAGEWRDVNPYSVAVSSSMPDSILVICWMSNEFGSYVYQFPCQESVEYEDKYQIYDGTVRPWCIAANANIAVIGTTYAIVVCRLPGFTNQIKVKLSLNPLDICITTDYLAVMGLEGIVIKSLGSIDQEVCRIQAPNGWLYDAVSFRNDARQLYVACDNKNGRKSAVFKYTWDGDGTPQYINTGCVIDNLDEVWTSGLSISANGLLCAVSPLGRDTQVFSLD